MSGTYGTSTVKPKRTRATRLDMVVMNHKLWNIVQSDSQHGEHPVTVRQVYYRAVGGRLVAKDTKEDRDRNYRKVIRHIGNMRESGELEWSWIADNARVRRERDQHQNLSDALQEWLHLYRRDYWAAQPLRVEVWVESDAIASALTPTILPSGVPIYTCRGQASKTFIQAAARDSAALGKPIHILYAGDWDPTGLAIDRSLEERYQRYADEGADIRIQRVAVTPQQIREFGLTGGPVKTGDPNYKRFLATCGQHGFPPVAIEAEELPPAVLRQSVADAIQSLIDPHAWQAVMGYEQAEIEQLNALFGAFHRGEHLS